MGNASNRVRPADEIADRDDEAEAVTGLDRATVRVAPVEAA